MCKELVVRGIRVGTERVRWMMKEHGIKARGKRKFVLTIDNLFSRQVVGWSMQSHMQSAL
jgi:transposase InsO family protein